MSDITVYARAPNRAAGLAFMAATGVAEETKDEHISEPGYWTWLVDEIDEETGEKETVSVAGPELPPGAVGAEWVEPVSYIIPGGQIIPKVQAVISTSDNFPTPADGWFVNIRYYGASAEALANGGDPTATDLFDRYPGLLAISEVRTGKPMEWKALPGDPTPPGYENADGIRLYDPAFIATPANVIA